MDTCVLMADSLCCAPQSISFLISYTPIKKKTELGTIGRDSEIVQLKYWFCYKDMPTRGASFLSSSAEFHLKPPTTASILPHMTPFLTPQSEESPLPSAHCPSVIELPALIA